MNNPTAPAVVAVMFTDIEGSTRLWERDPDRMSRALARHDELSRAAVDAQRGTVVKMTGDGMFAVFADPSDALRAALALQCSLADPQATAGVALRVRCGLHAGAAERRGDDWFGTPVNRAARIAGAAHGGQVLLSQAAVELVRDRLPDGSALREIGVVRLRDLANPETLSQLVHPSLRPLFPPLRSLEATPNNLPRQATSFVGRDNELKEAARLLDDARLVTIVGPGGIGKTRLSLQVAADRLDRFDDGAWLVELAALADPASVPLAVAQVLGLPEDAGTDAVRSVAAHLATRRVLLVLDNCEHLIGACARLVDALLRAAPDVRVLASSREPLDVGGEQTYALRPLSLPRPDTEAGDIGRSEAVRLFVERARLRRPGFDVTGSNGAAVAQICTRLDGIPLALELAAARVGAMTVEAIADRLGDRFRLLTGGGRTALPRQQTLRALIDWSYDLLADAEKTLFARLSAFAGGWTLDAAEDVCSDATTLARDDVLDLVTGLVHKSIVVADGEGERYRMLESLRDYARERLQARGEHGDVRARHAAHFVALAEQAEPRLEGGSEQPAWLARLDQEHDNLRAALTWSVEAGDRADAGMRLCGAMYRFWAHRGHAREGLRWCEDVLARAPGVRSPACAKALHAAGTLAWRLGDTGAARARLEQALELSRALGDARGEGRILSNLGGVAIHQADPAAARAFLERAIEINRLVGDVTLETRGLNNLAALAIHESRYADAQEVVGRALALSRRLGNRMEEATATSHLGTIAHQDGRLDEAQALHELALAVAREFGVREFELEEARELGAIALARRDPARARTNFSAALGAANDLASPYEIARCLEAIAELAVHEGAHVEAGRLLGAANALRRASATPRVRRDQDLYDSVGAACGRALGAPALAEAVAAGESLSGDDAVGCALARLRGGPDSGPPNL